MIFSRIKYALYTSLHFESEMEAAFQQDYFEKVTLRSRPSIILGFFFYELFYLLDIVFVPDIQNEIMVIRFGIVGPAILTLYYLSFQKIYRKHHQLFTTLGILFAGEGIVAMCLIAPEYSISYYAGIILILIYCYMLMGLRFYWASTVGFVVVVSYVGGIVFFTDIPFTRAINNYFFLIGSNILLMFAGYFTEAFRRRDFQLRYQLHAESQKIEMINADLEHRIAKRTSELELEVAERKHAQKKTKKALKEKEILLKEVYHRTKNNMNVVISLLNLQSSELKDMETKQVFKQIAGRIYSMSLVHEQLYGSDDLETIRLDHYLPKLVSHLKYSFANTPGQIMFNFDCEPIEIGLERAVPLGLALNEVITNAFKHSFPDGRKGNIDFNMKAVEADRILIEIRNDGVSLPEEINTEKPETLGLRLIHLLIAEQLKGEFSISSEDGVLYSLELDQNSES